MKNGIIILPCENCMNGESCYARCWRITFDLDGVTCDNYAEVEGGTYKASLCDGCKPEYDPLCDKRCGHGGRTKP